MGDSADCSQIPNFLSSVIESQVSVGWWQPVIELHILGSATSRHGHVPTFQPLAMQLAGHDFKEKGSALCFPFLLPVGCNVYGVAGAAVTILDHGVEVWWSEDLSIKTERALVFNIMKIPSQPWTTVLSCSDHCHFDIWYNRWTYIWTHTAVCLCENPVEHWSQWGKVANKYCFLKKVTTN